MRSLVYGLIIFSGVILLILSARAQKQGRIQVVACNKDKKPDVFEVVAWYLYQIICVRFMSKCRKGSIFEYLLQAPQVRRDLRAINPDVRPELAQAQYYVQKIKWFLMLFYIGDLLALCIHISSLGGGIIYQDKYIDRNSYGEGQKQTFAQVITEDGMYGKKVQLLIDETVFAEDELDTLFEKAVSELEFLVLGENSKQKKVCESLKLPSALEGYPFELEWESSDYFLMDHQGIIQKEDISENGESVTLTCRFSYRDWQKDYQLAIEIFPKEKTSEEVWEERVEDAIDLSNKEQLEQATYVLPDQIGGKQVFWKEIPEDYSLTIWVLLFFASCCIYMLQDRDLHQKTEARSEQMLTEYPVLVNRLTLYLGAGMTIKGAWNKIAKDYRERKDLLGVKNYTYEEMLFTSYEMQSGISEGNAYERFGKRCGLQPYTRLIGLLCQSLKKGNAALLHDLQKEAEDSQEARRNLARKKGEEAGTKLLLPMMMMLGIVMVLVMVPAFFSFSM